MKSNAVKNFFVEQKILILIVLISIGMTLKASDFLGFENILNIFMKISVEGIMVIGMTYLIILREIDLSIGETMAMSCVFSVIFQSYGVVPGVLAGVLIGTLIGLINGFLVVKLKVASIAATLGMMVLLNGIVYVITKSRAAAGGNYSISGTNENFQRIAETTFFHVPTLIFVLIVLMIIFDVVLKKTMYGRNVYACGGNPVASRYANIPVDSIRMIAFTITGALAGLSGVMVVSRYNIASGALGQPIPLFVITAVILGGVSLAGGEGSVFKAFQGLLLVGVLENALLDLKVFTSIKFVVMGLLLIIMLVVDSMYTRKAKFM
jgi:ribose/xylose/arabinose/galactoside ABC-type transport system permease subunit